MILPHCPKGPDWLLDWQAIDRTYPWIRAMKGVPQSPVYHAEGDVWVHTEMVCRALIGLPAWRNLPATERDLVFWAALLHDIAKPKTTRTEDDGRITARGHSREGAAMARTLLWHMGLPFHQREQVVNMVRHHQVPFWLIERDDQERMLRKVSWTTRCDWLSLLAEADLRGRICQDHEEVLERIELFRELAHELNCFHQKAPVLDGTTRFMYATERWHQTDYPPGTRFKSRVIIMCGLPGAGKDHWLVHHAPDLPMISLDRIRRRMGVKPEDKQVHVVEEARESARVYLRQGKDFVWNATNISKRLRDRNLKLFLDYGAHVTLVYVEVPADRLYAQNRQREHIVPDHALARMLTQWVVPDAYEAHEVIYAVS